MNDFRVIARWTATGAFRLFVRFAHSVCLSVCQTGFVKSGYCFRVQGRLVVFQKPETFFGHVVSEQERDRHAERTTGFLRPQAGKLRPMDEFLRPIDGFLRLWSG